MWTEVLKGGVKALAGTIGVLVGLVIGAAVVSAALPDFDLFPKRTIAVDGRADIAVEADKVEVHASVRTPGATAGEALEKNSAVMAVLIAGLTGDGVERRDIKTTAFGIRQQRGRGQAGVAFDDLPVTGYVAETSISVGLPIAKYSGKIVDQLVRLGATEVGLIEFVVGDSDAHVAQMRVKAVEDAQRKGLAVAQALGYRLGRAVRVEQSDSGFAQRNFVGSASNQAELVSAGPRTRTFSGGVNVVFELD
jgi:uncharacterized protein YggE